jgi:hypothetical protein
MILISVMYFFNPIYISTITKRIKTVHRIFGIHLSYRTTDLVIEYV